MRRQSHSGFSAKDAQQHESIPGGWLPNWTEKATAEAVITTEPEPEPTQASTVPGGEEAAPVVVRPRVRWEVATPDFLAWIDRGVTLAGLERGLGTGFWEQGESSKP